MSGIEKSLNSRPDPLKILEMVIEFAFWGIVFLVPLYFGFWFETASFFVAGKLFIFRLLLILIFLGTVLRFIFFGSELSRKNLKDLLRANWAILLFFGFLALSLFWSLDWRTSFFGLYDRQAGLTDSLYFLAFFVLALLNLRFIRKERLFYVISISGFLVSLYGILQYLGIDFITWTEGGLLSRVSSSIGQPNFLGAFLLFAIPISSYLLFLNRRSRIAYFFGFSTFISLICLYLTASRGAILGFILGFLLLVLFVYFRSGKSKNIRHFFARYRVAWLGGALLLFVVLIFVFSGARFRSSFDFSAGSVAARVNIWSSAIRGIEDKPILGYGVENQGIVFQHYYDKSWAIHGDLDVYADRAHNIVLDTLLTEGIAGLIISTIFLIYIIRLIIRSLSRKASLGFSFFISWALLAYFIYLLTSFSTVVDSVYFWLFLAILALAGAECGQLRARNSKIFYKILLIITALIISTTILIVEWRSIEADYYYRQSLDSFLEKNYTEALSLFLETERIAPRSIHYQIKFSNLICDHLNDINDGELKNLYFSELSSLVPIFEENVGRNRLVLARIYSSLAPSDSSLWALAEENYTRSINSNPHFVRNYLLIANMHSSKREFDKAYRNCLEGLKYLPLTENTTINERHLARINTERNLLYKCLAESSRKMGDYVNAEKNYRAALRLNVYDLSLYKKISELAYLQGDFEKALWYNKRGAMLGPHDWAWPFATALLYERMGDSENYYNYLLKSAQLAPENLEIQERIKKAKNNF